MYLVTAWQMQQMDKKTIRDFGIPGFVLMENAGRGAVRMLLEQFDRLENKKVGIICGKGNNGGDGFVIGRYLAARDIPVTVYLLCDMESVKGDAKEHLQLLTRLNVPVIEICDQKDLLKHKSAMMHRDIWVDAIFGTGLNTEVTGFYRAVIELVNSLDKPVFSVDIPSGLHPDTGQPLGVCIKAHATVTFGYAKTGMLLYPGADHSGRIGIVDIGIPPHIARESLLTCQVITPDRIYAIYRKRRPDSHKGDAGHLFVIAGSTGKSGAAALCAHAAMRIGAGLVTLGCPISINPILENMTREVMTLPLPETKDGCFASKATEEISQFISGKNCLAIGPGIGTAPQTIEMVHDIISKCTVPLVLDADALNCIENQADLLKKKKTDIVLTPHPKEMSRISGKSVSDIQKDRIGSASAFAEKYRVHLVLKGARTVIAHPDGHVYVNPTGNPALSSGGTGDVLTGMIAGLISQGYTIKEACHMAVYLHGATADELSSTRGASGILASDIVEKLPEILKTTASGQLKPISFITEDL